MPKRITTPYPGVKYRIARRTGTTGTEKVYYIRYKREGRLYEEKAGREHSDSMTAAKAANIRLQKIDGTLKPKSYATKYKREAQLQLDQLINIFQETGDPIAALRAFCHAYNKRLPIPHSVTTYMANRITLYINGNAQSLDHALGLNKQPMTAPKNHRIAKEELFKQTIQGIFDYLFLNGNAQPGTGSPHLGKALPQNKGKKETAETVENNTTAQPLLTETQVAKQLHLAVQTMRNWRYANRGPRWVTLGRAIRYAPADIEAFISQGHKKNSGNIRPGKRKGHGQAV